MSTVNLHDPNVTKRFYPEGMKTGDEIMVRLARGYWTVGILDNGVLCDLHEDFSEIAGIVLYSDVLPNSSNDSVAA